MFFYMIWVLNFLMALLSFCQGKSGSKHFSLGRTSLVAMEAKLLESASKKEQIVKAMSCFSGQEQGSR
jgi:hypothetical protein